MKKFKFKLETVLSHRTVLEEQAMRAFAEVQNELAACLARIVAMQMEFHQVVSTRPKTFDAEEMTLRERHLDQLRNRIEVQERLREGLAARLEDARERLVSARQDRETVGGLREIELAGYRKEVLKADQDAIDELATMRHNRVES